FGVALERRPSVSRWADWSWRVTAVLPEFEATGGWRTVAADGELRRYVAGRFALTLHHRMVQAYDANLETGSPSIWVVLSEVAASGDAPPWRVAVLTADPYEAEGYLESAEALVEKVAMPPQTVAWLAGFLRQLPEPPKFQKRRRTQVEVEDHKFGKVPIFSPEGRRSPDEGPV